MIQKWFLRLQRENGSVTAETAISLAFLITAGVVLVQVLAFAMQFQRLQTLAQESSRVAASLEDPKILENEITGFIRNIDSEIKVIFDWQNSDVKVTLTQPTSGIVSQLREVVSASATAPRWN